MVGGPVGRSHGKRESPLPASTMPRQRRKLDANREATDLVVVMEPNGYHPATIRTWRGLIGALLGPRGSIHRREMKMKPYRHLAMVKNGRVAPVCGDL